MLPAWLFEADVFGRTAEPLQAEVRRQGMACAITRQDLLAHGLFSASGFPALDEVGCVIACGSFPFVHWVQTHTRWVPGGWCDAERLDCGSYYRPFQEFLLNGSGELVRCSEAVDRRDELFERMAVEGRVFVRPSGCAKTFTGRAVTREEFIETLGPSRYDASARIVVAPARQLDREWRLVVAGDEMVAACQYYEQGELAVVPGLSGEVEQFAQRALDVVDWRPDPIFILDVGQTDDGPAIVELGGFSCCALYECDPAAVVRVASALAAGAWSTGGIRA